MRLAQVIAKLAATLQYGFAVGGLAGKHSLHEIAAQTFFG